MTIIFYDPKNQITYICPEGEKSFKVSDSENNLMKFIPNDDILYVQKGHFLTKKQFQGWISGNLEIEDTGVDNKQEYSGFHESVDSENRKEKKYIHTTKPGYVTIGDIKTSRFPNGVFLDGKWDFIDIDELGGEEALQSSAIFRNQIKQRRVEIVPEEYYNANKHKKKSTSLVDANLASILIPREILAANAARAGGMENMHQSDMIEINVES